MDKIYIGIDNGVSGSIGIIAGNGPLMFRTPVKLQQDYTKKKKNLNRLDVHAFNAILRPVADKPCIALLERPLVNPTMFHATISAVRCLEAQLCVLETMKIPHLFVDSRSWQKLLLPQGCKGEALKPASRDIGIRLFPSLEGIIRSTKDADGILIAEWARRSGL